MLKQIFNFVTFDLFKKVPKEELNQLSAIIKVNPIARMNGQTDDFNKIIVLIDPNGNQVAEFPYTEAHVKALREIDEIPVEHEKLSEKFNWNKVVQFGGVEYKR
jgi:hypothetical protein